VGREKKVQWIQLSITESEVNFTLLGKGIEERALSNKPPHVFFV